MKKFLPLSLVLFLFLFAALISNAQIVPPYGGGLNVGVSGGDGTTGTTITSGLTPTPTIKLTKTPTPIPTKAPVVTPTISQGPGTSVGGQVGEYYLSLSGFSSPFASIALISDNTNLRSTISNEDGSFSISQVLIKAGFCNFCLKATDIRNLGDSTTCISTEPAEDNVSVKDIFLPPTLGVWKKEVALYEPNLAFGYTMPGASVTLHISPIGGGASQAQILTTVADSNGYYRFELKFPGGKYELFATARYQNVDSKSPSKTVSVNVLTGLDLFIAYIKDLFNKFINLLTASSLGPLLLAIPIIILIIILLTKLWGRRLTSILGHMPRLLIPSMPLLGRKRKLHHWWFIGY